MIVFAALGFGDFFSFFFGGGGGVVRVVPTNGYKSHSSDFSQIYRTDVVLQSRGYCWRLLENHFYKEQKFMESERKGGVH